MGLLKNLAKSDFGKWLAGAVLIGASTYGKSYPHTIVGGWVNSLPLLEIGVGLGIISGGVRQAQPKIGAGG